MSETGRRRSRHRNVQPTREEAAIRAPGIFVGSGTFSAQTTGATVVRLNRDTDHGGIGPFEATGLQIASSRDFRETEMAPDLGGADMLVFERFGIAIVDTDPDRMTASLARGIGARTVLSQRPELIFHTLGMEMIEPASVSAAGMMAPASSVPGIDQQARDYLLGYLSGVAGLVGHALGGLPSFPGGTTPLPVLEAATVWDETAATWGLQATNVVASRHSGQGIRVAILDTGIDFGHPDFINRNIVSKSFIPGQDVQDGAGHGTHCAGTACGPLKPNGGKPHYGIAHEADLYVGKVLSNGGTGSDRSVIGGLEWALDNGCEIISMSLGAAVAVNEPYIEDYEQIGKDALRSRSLIIAAAGNESDRPRRIAPVGSPANCPSIFAVAAVDKDLRVARFSCGKRSEIEGGAIDIAAPGVDVFSSVPTPRLYARFQGTSMAAPHVSGVAALYAQSDPELRAMSLWGALTQGRRPIPGDERDVGVGLAQAPGA